MSDCVICGRECETECEMCQYHEMALKNLKTVYSKWKVAFDISWEEYLSCLTEIEGTGAWIHDMIEYLTAQNES